MEAKSKPRDSAHFNHICVFHDKPKWQRQHEANLRLVVKTFGTNKLYVRGSRVCFTDERENDWHNQNGRDQARGRGRNRVCGRGAGQDCAGGQGQNLMGMRFWNINGWSMDTTNDKSVIQTAIILKCDLDIIGIAETHLRDDTIPHLDGYTAFTHNCPQQHRRARCGSGGVCILVKKLY